MKKYIVILFIFLAGFIFAGTNANSCDISSSAIVKIHNNTSLSHDKTFLSYENNLIKENIKSTRNTNEQDNSSSFNPETFLSFENINNLIYEKQHVLTSGSYSAQKFENIKFELFPRAP